MADRDPPAAGPGAPVPAGAENAIDLYISFLGPIIYIGRDPRRCTVQIDGVSVSRRHMAVAWADAGGFQVCDMGSRNGTWLWRARDHPGPAPERGRWRRVPGPYDRPPSQGLFGSWGDFLRAGPGGSPMVRILEPVRPVEDGEEEAIAGGA